MASRRVIALLTALADETASSFALEHNEGRYDPPLQPRRRAAREITPARDQLVNEERPVRRLRLTFDNGPHDWSEGFVFGRDDLSCDVLLADFESRVSRQHFAIAFNDAGHVILRDLGSTYGTTVSYNRQHGDQVRAHFTWILFTWVHTFEVRIPETDIAFRVELSWDARSPPKILENFFAACQSSEQLPKLRPLGLESRTSTAAPSGSKSPPGQDPIYHFEANSLGSGGFGTVYKVHNVSTGEQYAAKLLSRPRNAQAILVECVHDEMSSEVGRHLHILLCRNFFCQYMTAANPCEVSAMMSYNFIGGIH